MKKIKALMKRSTKGTRVSSMTNENYQKLCDEKLKDEIKEIKKVYISSLNNSSNFYVR